MHGTGSEVRAGRLEKNFAGKRICQKVSVASGCDADLAEKHIV